MVSGIVGRRRVDECTSPIFVIRRTEWLKEEAVKGLRLEGLTSVELLDVRDYVEALLKRRSGKERREIEAALARISEATEDRPGRGRASKLRGMKVPPKYRDPKTGESWSGRGTTPRWLRALMKKGHKLQKFAVGAQSTKKKKATPTKKRRATSRRKRPATGKARQIPKKRPAKAAR